MPAKRLQGRSPPSYRKKRGMYILPELWVPFQPIFLMLSEGKDLGRIYKSKF
jgi:hypothetical protein